MSGETNGELPIAMDRLRNNAGIEIVPPTHVRLTAVVRGENSWHDLGPLLVPVARLGVVEAAAVVFGSGGSEVEIEGRPGTVMVRETPDEIAAMLSLSPCRGAA